MKIVFLGPPGAGKGTQALRISEHCGVPSLSTGDIFRSVAQNEDTLGLQVKTLMSQGVLISDELVVEVVLSKLSDELLSQGFILDGFPRTVIQAQLLEDFLISKKTQLDFIINIQVDHSILFNRIQKRVSESGKSIRADDTADVLKNRINVYNSETAPVVSFYKERNMLLNIDGMQSIEKVTQDIIDAISN